MKALTKLLQGLGASALRASIGHLAAVSEISVSISEDGVITMYNNGNGIDVEKHPEHDHWIPEMIFAHLRTSTNYDKKTIKIVGDKRSQPVLFFDSIQELREVITPPLFCY